MESPRHSLFSIIAAQLTYGQAKVQGIAPHTAEYDDLWRDTKSFMVAINNLLIYIALAMLMGALRPALLLLAITTPLSGLAHGFHISKPIVCTVYSMLTLLWGARLSTTGALPLVWHAVLLIACVIVFLLYAPAISNLVYVPEVARKARRRQVLCIVALYAPASFLFAWFGHSFVANLLLASLVLKSIAQLPVMFHVVEGKLGLAYVDTEQAVLPNNLSFAQKLTVVFLVIGFLVVVFAKYTVLACFAQWWYGADRPSETRKAEIDKHWGRTKHAHNEVRNV